MYAVCIPLWGFGRADPLTEIGPKPPPSPQTKKGTDKGIGKGCPISRYHKFAHDEYEFYLIRYYRWWSRVRKFQDAPSFNGYALSAWMKENGSQMPRKNSTGATQAASGAGIKKEDTAWANIRISPEDGAIILEESGDVLLLCSRLAALFLSGSDFSLRYNPARSNFSAFVISPAHPSTGTRTGISAFGPTSEIALSAIIYKYELYLSDPTKFTTGGGNLGIG